MGRVECNGTKVFQRKGEFPKNMEKDKFKLLSYDIFYVRSSTTIFEEYFDNLIILQLYKFRAKLSYKKDVRKMLVKLTLGIWQEIPKINFLEMIPNAICSNIL